MRCSVAGAFGEHHQTASRSTVRIFLPKADTLLPYRKASHEPHAENA